MENVRNVNPIKVDKTTIINLEKGKLPPQALDLEEAVLGAMMIDKKGVDEVIDILQPDAFYKDAHKYIFEAIVQLFNETQPIDLLTVSAQLKKNGKLGQLVKAYNLETEIEDKDNHEILDILEERFGIIKKEETNYNKVSRFLLRDYRSGKIGKFSLETTK